MLLSESEFEVPTYHEKPNKAGLYLALFHGRDSPYQPMDDWGFDGPLIGPIDWCHTTYANLIRIKFTHPESEAKYFIDHRHPDGHDLLFRDDLVIYGGKFYGDWTVFNVPLEGTAPPADTFRPAVQRKSYLPRHHRD